MTLPKQIKSKLLGGGGGAPSPSDSVQVFDFSVSTGMTYGPTQIEFVNGAASLKNQFASDVTFAALYATTMNLSYSRDGGVLTPSSVVDGVGSTGPVGITQSALTFAGGAFAKVTYQPNKNLNGYGLNTFRARIRPMWTDAPATNQWFFVATRTVGADNNGYKLTQITNGDFYQEGINYFNTLFLSHAFSWTHNATDWHEIEANWNTVAGVNNLYVGATRRITSGATGLMTWMMDYFQIGANALNTTSVFPQFQIKDVMMFDAVQNSGTTRAIGYTVPLSKYLTDNPAVETSPIAGVDSISLVDVVWYASGSDTVKAQVRVGAQLKYWDGADWVNSDGSYAQASTIADLEAEISSLTTSNSAVAFRFLAHSETGLTTPYISSVTVEYVA